MKRKRSPWLSIALSCAGEALLLWGLWRGILHETGAANQAVGEISDLKDPSPFRAALTGHLGKIHLSLQGYLRSPDPSLAKQAADSRQDFESSLPEFAGQNPRLFPSEAADEIRRAFELFKGAIDQTLEANTRRTRNRGLLEQNFTRMLDLLDRHLRPLIRKDQPDGDERGEAALNIENQMRAWQQNLAQAWTQPSEAALAVVFDNDNRGETYLERYGRLELLPRERKIQREIRTLWKANSHLARESFALESGVSQSASAMNAGRQQVISALNRFLPVMPPAQLEIRKQAILRMIWLRTAAASALGFLGLVSLIVVALRIYRLTRASIRTPASGASNTEARPPLPRGSDGEPTEPTFQMDLKGKITTWSASAEALYGYNAAEMRGQSIGSLFESESEISRLYRELQAARQAFFDATHKTKTGAFIPIRIEFRPIAGGAGRAPAIGIVCTRR